MCTAISFHGPEHYFGRTLDYERSFGEEVVFTPRNFPLPFRQVPGLNRHHAILGMAHVAQGYPLYYDAMNEGGLCVAGLNFVGFARYPGRGRDRIAPFEFIPWVLGQCETVEQAKVLLTHTALTATDFSDSLPTARLHWLIADAESSIVVESMEDGLHIHDDPIGVLTNNPPFPEQLRHLGNFSHLSPETKDTCFPGIRPVSRGTGAVGLPGDLSSQSRFVRAAFTKANAAPGGISRFFQILDTVRQVKGCCRLHNGEQEQTIYTSCCDTARRRYCYTTHGNRRINCIDMNRENHEGTTLVRFKLLTNEDVLLQN